MPIKRNVSTHKCGEKNKSKTTIFVQILEPDRWRVPRRGSPPTMRPPSGCCCSPQRFARSCRGSWLCCSYDSCFPFVSALTMIPQRHAAPPEGSINQCCGAVFVFGRLRLQALDPTHSEPKMKPVLQRLIKSG